PAMPLWLKCPRMKRKPRPAGMRCTNRQDLEKRNPGFLREPGFFSARSRRSRNREISEVTPTQSPNSYEFGYESLLLALRAAGSQFWQLCAAGSECCPTVPWRPLDKPLP